MTKRLLALLTALLLALGCCPAYADGGHDKADYMGYWAVETLTLMGMEFSAESLGLSGFMSFHEDGTVVLSTTGDGFQGSMATFADGGCTISSSAGKIPVVIGADGRLRWETTMDGMTVSVTCVRSQPPAIPAQAAAMTGLWEMTGLMMDGAAYSDISGLGRYTVSIYDDGYGVIENPQTRVLFQLSMVDGVLKGQDGEGVYFPLKLQEGQLHVQMTGSGHELELITERVGGAPVAQPPAEAPSGLAAAQQSTCFDGVWTPVPFELMGLQLGADTVDLAIELVITGETAVLSVDGEAVSCSVRADGYTCVLYDGEEEIPCSLQEDGSLRVRMEMDGIVLDMLMTRSDAVPAEEEPAATPTWDNDSPLSSFLSGASVPVEEPAEEEPAATPTWDSDSPLSSFLNGASAPAEEPAEEEPAATPTWDSDSPLSGFLNGASAPAEEPAEEEPAATPTWDSDNPLASFLSGASVPVEEETPPSTSLDGTWQVAYVEKNGALTPAAQAGVTGTLTVAGESGRWTQGASSSLGIVTQDASGVRLTTRAGDFFFSLNEQGYLCLNSDDMVLWLSRGDLAAPIIDEPVTEAPATGVSSSDNALSSFLSGGSTPAVEEPVVEEPVTEAPATGVSSSDNALSSFLSGGSTPAVEEPVVEEPVVEEPVTEAPATGVSSSDNALSSFLSGGSTPVVEEPVVEEPVTEAPATGISSSDNALASFLSGGSTPVVEEPVVEEPVVEEPVVEEPVVEEPVVEEPAVEEPVPELPEVGGLGSDNALSSFLSGGTGVPASQTPQANVAVEGATAVPGYEGRWRTVTINAMGLTFAAEDLSATGYEVQFNGAAAEFIVDGTAVLSGSLVVTDTGVEITDGISSMPCHFDAEGNLVVIRLESGVTMEMIMQRVDK